MELSEDTRRDSRLSALPDASSDTEMEAHVNRVDQEETSKMESHVKPTTEWTDEKHSLYLKSIEASFVDQLYSSMGFPSFQPPRKVDIKSQLHSSIKSSAGQFKTLRGGSWQRINVGKRELLQIGQNTSHALLSNQWIRHYRHSEGHQLLESSRRQGKAATTTVDHEMNSSGKTALPNIFTSSLKISNAVPSNLEPPIFTDDDTEASGQNFVDEDIVKQRLGIVRSSRRARTQAPVNESSNDQRVP